MCIRDSPLATPLVSTQFNLQRVFKIYDISTHTRSETSTRLVNGWRQWHALCQTFSGRCHKMSQLRQGQARRRTQLRWRQSFMSQTGRAEDSIQFELTFVILDHRKRFSAWLFLSVQCRIAMSYVICFMTYKFLCKLRLCKVCKLNDWLIDWLFNNHFYRQMKKIYKGH